MRDGDIDYSRYTLLELEEALAGINRHQYPKNYANLRSAHEQLTAAFAETHQQPPAAMSDAAEHESSKTPWEKFWNSRPIVGVLGALCIWSSYDLFTHPGTCSSGKRLMAAAINAICENFGSVVAAGIPFVIGLASIAYAVLPRRPAA